MCFFKKKREKQKLENEKKMAELYSPEEQKEKSKELLDLCQTHINSILNANKIYTKLDVDYESQLRPECLEQFYKIQEFYSSGAALRNIEILKKEIENVSCFGEYLRIFNKAVELGTQSINHLTYAIQSHKPRR